ncbi:TolC family protein [Pseudomonas matsuisoli]|uniref:Multidrug efflux outer membrane protein OprN n=1 Tax=Pseudomonas matsuisoli TaxID=1515666 RepID=A0A917PRY3_9PSED|nr:TolC family protein [Pseudomonas matsuisoli]GGJ89602.1 multidrug efflux outer membrane protein OprN [Pseudomonas matsuisoli]
MIKRMLSLICVVLVVTGCAGRSEPLPPALPDEAVAQLPQRWWEDFEDDALDRLVSLALADNLDLAAATERIRELRANRRQASSQLMPSVAISGSHENGRSASDGHDEDYFYGLDLAWELDLFGRLRALSRAAEAEGQAAVADYRALRVSLIADVAGAYLDYRLAQREERIARRSADSQAETARITRIRFEQGTASGFDVERFTAQVDITRAAIPVARERAANARYTLAYLLNREQTEIDAILAGPVVTSDLPGDERLLALLDLPAASLRSRPDVRAAEWRMLLADEELNAARALRFPQLTLGGLVGFEQGTSPAAWSLTGQILQPLVDFGQIRATIEASDARQRQAMLAYQSSLIGALRETRSAIASYAQGLERQRLLGRAVSASMNATELARRQYDSGTVSLIEVLDAERTLFDAQLSEVQASTDVMLRWVQIYRTLGLAPTPGHL